MTITTQGMIQQDLSVEGTPSSLTLQSVTFESTADGHTHSIYFSCVNGTEFLPDGTITKTIALTDSSIDSSFIVVESGRGVSEERVRVPH